MAEKKSENKWVNHPLVYSLSIAVYCTAWTYYGSVGIAAESGISFLPIYLGPVIAVPLWIIAMRKIIRISKQNKISSIADFISLRYGNHRFLGALVTIISVLGIVPYISLQLKAISESFEILTNTSHSLTHNIFYDTTFYIAVILALFAAFYGTQKTDASEKHRGIVVSAAFESIVKLVFFLVIGVYVTFYLFDGTQDIYDRISKTENFEKLISFNGLESGFNWLFMIMLSFMAIFLLPRQFQVSVVENLRERHLKHTIWFFPLYLLLFNFFVIFIAWGGKLNLGETANAEYFALLLPLQNGNTFLALLVFLGGFSAVISMVVVSTLALSTMLSNNLIIPYGYLSKFSKADPEKNTNNIKTIRRISIFSLIILAFLFYRSFSIELSLYAIGLISFVIIAQLGPSFFFGLVWKRGSARASIVGIIIGFLFTFYTLILPFTIQSLTESTFFVENGPFGIALLKPYSLLGVDFLSPPAHAFFWSMLFNTITFLVVSISFRGNYRERNYAELFIDNKNYSSLQDNAFVWKGEAYVSNIKNVLNKFLGTERTERALDLFFRKYDLPKDTEKADARLINFSEKLLTGSIGSASAKILISNVIKEEEISLIEVLKILEESKENISHNKNLQEKSKELTQLTDQLKNANNELIFKDKQKDDFLDTVAHEIKTPLTGIRAATELLIDDEDEMPSELKQKFLNNILQDSDRLSRMINNILDFEKLTTDRISLDSKTHNLKKSIEKTIESLMHIANQNNISIDFSQIKDVEMRYDEDRIIQVITNLISNAMKFCDKANGKIFITNKIAGNEVEVCVTDNGKGIPMEDINYIFDKFYQSKNQNTKKPEGSGLGLAISKQIIEKHQGKIWVENIKNSGARFVFKLPLNN